MELTNNFEYLPPDIEGYYTWEVVTQDWIEYSVMDPEKVYEGLKDSTKYLYGKKTEPTLIREWFPWEEIITYVKNKSGEYVNESKIVVKEWDYVFKNTLDEYDVYVPQNHDMSQYEAVNPWEEYGKDFKLFRRKSKPIRVFPWVIVRPTFMIIESWDNFEQYLWEWSTLKLEWSYVTGINMWGFDAWSIVNEEWTILEKETERTKKRIIGAL